MNCCRGAGIGGWYWAASLGMDADVEISRVLRSM